MNSSPTPSILNRLTEPDITEYLNRRMRDIGTKLNCHTIGTIVSFNPALQTAVVSVNFLTVVKGVNPLGNTGQTTDQIQTPSPQLIDVPIIFLQGGSSYITMPIAAGDTCLVLFNDRDMDTWLQTGQTAVPLSNRIHSINDAMALVGLRSLVKTLANYNPNLISITDRSGERLNQSGFMQPTAASTAPSGWLLCFGQSLLRTDYPDLFTAIGTTWGSVDGTHFSIPDMRGAIPVGLDNMGGSNANVLTPTYNPNRNTLGAAIGEESHHLIIAELPAHSHPIHNSHGGGGGGGDLTNLQRTDNANEGGVNTNPDVGSDTPHQNVQPGRMVNWLIKI